MYRRAGFATLLYVIINIIILVSDRLTVRYSLSPKYGIDFLTGFTFIYFFSKFKILAV